MVDDFVPPGGTGTVVAWLQELVADQPGPQVWTPLTDDLRLALAQGWLLTVGAASRPDRDDVARELADGVGTPALLEFLVRHWRRVYAGIDGRPCLVSVSDVVGVDMELVAITSEEHAGAYAAGAQIPAHCFITQLTGPQWQIAATARRLPVPGWPPSERTVPGLVVDRSA